jgi:hypothetical protein
MRHASAIRTVGLTRRDPRRQIVAYCVAAFAFGFFNPAQL